MLIYVCRCIPFAFLIFSLLPVFSYSADDSDDTVQSIVYKSGSIWNDVYLHDPPVKRVMMNETLEVHLMFSKHYVRGNWQGTRESLNFPITSRRFDNINPGWTFAIKKGTTFKLRLVNDLQGTYGPNTEDITCNLAQHSKDMISYKCMNHTNLHWHGFTTDPRNDHDDVTMIDIAPGQNFTYTIHVMDEHCSGLNWYHPHRHGSASLQVTSGAYGAAVILDDEITEDTDPDLAMFLKFPEHIIFLSYHYLELYEYTHLLQSSGASTKEVELYNKEISSMFNYTGNPYVTLTNGQFRPGIEITEKTYYRWRIVMAPVIFINVTFFPLWDFGANCSVRVIARDGVYFDSPDEITGNEPQLFSSGNRMDVIIYCESVPNFEDYLWDIAGQTIYNESDYLTAFFIPVFKKCEDGVCDSGTPWEETLPKRPQYMGAADMYDYTHLKARRVTWDFNYRDKANGPLYPNFWWSINKQAFNLTTPLRDEDTQIYSPAIPLNSFEIWRIETWENMGHVFHLHSNKFMVIDYFIANQHDVELGRSWDQLVGRWMDNVMVPLGNDYCHTGVGDHYNFNSVAIAEADNDTCIPGFIEILIQFYKYPGPRIFHCHFLNHEDHGMMSYVNVCEQEGSCYGSAKPETNVDVSQIETTMFSYSNSNVSFTDKQLFAIGIGIGASAVTGILLFYYVCCYEKRGCFRSNKTPYTEVYDP